MTIMNRVKHIRYGIISFVLGIIALSSSLLGYVIFINYWSYKHPFMLIMLARLLNLVGLIALLTQLVGLLFGLLGTFVWKQNKNLAIVGTVLCSLSIIWYLVDLFR